MSSLLLLIFSCIFPIKKTLFLLRRGRKVLKVSCEKSSLLPVSVANHLNVYDEKKLSYVMFFFLKFMFKKMATYTARTDTPMKKATYSTLHWIIRLWQTNQMLTNQLLEFDMLVLLVLTCHKLGISLNEDSLQIGLAQIHAIINFLQNSDLKRWV